MRFKTAREIFSEEGKVQVDWVAKPWLAKSAITDLIGKAKVAGKTTWALALCAAVLDGKDFMGEATAKTSIVYLTEESETSFRVALERAGIGPRDDFHVLFWREMIGTDWSSAVQEAVTVALAKEAGLLVVDTLPQFAGMIGDSENNAGDALKAVRPLQIARDKNLAVLMLRHERKQGGAVGDSGRGSSAFGGAVDIILNLGRPQGNHSEGIREIQAVSRFDDTPSRLIIERTDEGYRSGGTTTQPSADAAKDRLLSMLPRDEANAMSMDEILKVAKSESRATIQRVIAELKDAAQVVEIGEGKKGNPKRFYLSGNDSAQTQRVGYGDDEQKSFPDI